MYGRAGLEGPRGGGGGGRAFALSVVVPTGGDSGSEDGDTVEWRFSIKLFPGMNQKDPDEDYDSKGPQVLLTTTRRSNSALVPENGSRAHYWVLQLFCTKRDAAPAEMELPPLRKIARTHMPANGRPCDKRHG